MEVRPDPLRLGGVDYLLLWLKNEAISKDEPAGQSEMSLKAIGRHPERQRPEFRRIQPQMRRKANDQSC